MRSLRASLVTVLILCTLGVAVGHAQGNGLPNPVLFVTQVPVPGVVLSAASVFANHLPAVSKAPRGGNLHLLYPDGTLRNLTAEAGFGGVGFQGSNAIAVRTPEVHWSGTKAVFSMVIGSPLQQSAGGSYFWQLYEVTGLGQGQTAQIVKVPNQPTQANNLYPTYLSNGRILFTSDLPRRAAMHLYPLHDEYESSPSTTGVRVLDPATGQLDFLNHTPSGAFSPSVDSFGRVVFSRWDHLQRDQKADVDALRGNRYGSFNYSDESAGAQPLVRTEGVFPEPRPERHDLLLGTPLEGHKLNLVLPWQMRQDGTGEEMLNHLGRHELLAQFDRVRNDDPNVVSFNAAASGRTNADSIRNLLQMREDPTMPGRYLGTDAHENGTHGSGRLVSLFAPPSQNPDGVVVTSLTHPDTFDIVAQGATPSPGHSGHYRDPLPLSDGTLLAVHATETRIANNDGTRMNPLPRYHFRLRPLALAGNGYLEAGSSLTGGIQATVSYWDPGVSVRYSGPLWELDPVEVRARSVPPVPVSQLAPSELTIFNDEGLDPNQLSAWMAGQDLALIVVRNATARDAADRQQPFNLQVPGGTGTVGTSGTVYDIAHLELFQGDHLRGYGGVNNPSPGRRVIAQPMHHPQAIANNPPNPTGPAGSVAVAPDGSIAAFVPAERALAWQTVDPDGDPIVRERFWVTFQPGEIRACDGCHGVNTANQVGSGAAVQPPEALRTLVQHWNLNQLGQLFADSFEGGSLSAWSQVVP